MRLATVEQSRKIDQQTEELYGISGEVLMESAGSIACREIVQSFFPELKKGLTAIVCGPGNNGGDGLVVARHLHSSGYRNIVVFVVGKEKGSSLFQKQWKRMELYGIRFVDVGQSPEKLSQLFSAQLVIDALLGTGLQRPVEGLWLKVIDTINAVKVPVVSLDTPSGLNCDRGIIEGAAVRAYMTLTFGLAKPGFFTADGPHCIGKLRILPIGYSHEVLRSIATTHFAFTERLARRYLVAHKDRTNKYSHGKLLVIAGSEGMWGAGVLASVSGYRVGAGHVTWVSFEKPLEGLVEAPEVLTGELSEISDFSSYQAVIVGPGLRKTPELITLLQQLKSQQPRVVVDAGALDACAELLPLPASWVLTPHAGELSRLIGWEAPRIESHRYEAALYAAEKMGAHVLLKGFRSILAQKGRAMVIASGNSALAKAGTGDVLAGMVGGLYAQGLEPVQATATAAYLHGRMADEWVRSGFHKNALTASDLKENLPLIMGRLRQGTFI
ncbi:MAG: NAD(P)H-hydrate dehydratase [Bdellovibrio sp.]|nr:MAG: NAD(P)H-hydrate dehydratase [Bdellovibrio sp.]